jgi:serine acetyltransferase
LTRSENWRSSFGANCNPNPDLSPTEDVFAFPAKRDENPGSSPELRKFLNKSLPRRFLNRLFSLLARFSPGATTLRPSLHRLRGVKIGRGVFIGDDVYLDNEYPDAIEIHDHVQISIRTIVIAHTRGPGRIVVEKEAFIGPNCVVVGGAGQVVKIGAGAVIGAGSVITKSIPPGLYVAPAPTQCLARVDVPLTTAKSMESFRAGLRPLLAKPSKKSEESH